MKRKYHDQAKLKQEQRDALVEAQFSDNESTYRDDASIDSEKIDAERALIAHISQPPAGMVLVPVEPTPRMISALWGVGSDPTNTEQSAKEDWASLIAAAKEAK